MKVFWSWQSDTPGEIGRYFVRDALMLPLFDKILRNAVWTGLSTCLKNDSSRLRARMMQDTTTRQTGGHALRKLLEPLIDGLSQHYTHKDLQRICEELSLPAMTDGSTRDRMKASFSAVSDDQLPEVAERYLRHHSPDATLRNQLQDAIWAGRRFPEIPKRFRRELAVALGGADSLWSSSSTFEKLLDGLFILDDPFSFDFSDRPTGLRKDIRQHVFNNPDDWSATGLFDSLSAFSCSDGRFAYFLEGLASAEIRPDMANQHRFVSVVNESLKACSVELRESGSEGGYPVFKLVSTKRGVTGRPKNLIFASSTKPDIRFRDAVNNDVEVLSNTSEVLIYEQPISEDGLRWQALQAWWAARESLGDDKAKKSLYRRLLKCLPQNSPPQTLLFTTYFKRFASDIPKLPALLPEVWLHWDPKTARERGREALLRFRMDFLMLLPNSARVVIEVDGKHHYADKNGTANPAQYAEMMHADRDLRLTGYDVYRFGAQELTTDSGEKIVIDFFEKLFRLHGLEYSRSPS